VLSYHRKSIADSEYFIRADEQRVAHDLAIIIPRTKGVGTSRGLVSNALLFFVDHRHGTENSSKRTSGSD
jgi:hypothetical protein